MENNNVLKFQNCYGCGVCAKACGKKIIDINLDEKGFYRPFITNRELCTQCGNCISVCAYDNASTILNSHPLSGYAAWSKSKENLRKSTSGGVSCEIASSLLKQGYLFCGVRYNPDIDRVEHYITDTLEGISQSRGSKYLQSFTLDALSEIDRNHKYLFIGTPCQVASLKKYICKYRLEENFLLIDFFCHGVPSKLLWDYYVRKSKDIIGKIKSVSWRSKEEGWRKSYRLSIIGQEKTLVHTINSPFYTMFLGDACLNDACYDHCEFKCTRSASDIRVGDFWGIKYASNTEGVCSVLVFSEKGKKVLCNADLNIVHHEIEDVTAEQMDKRAKRPWYYKVSMILLSKHLSLTLICKLIYFQKLLKCKIEKYGSK